jgi:hypothetical protein
MVPEEYIFTFLIKTATHGLDKLLHYHLCVITSCSHCNKTAFDFFSAKYQPSQLLSARTLRFNLVIYTPALLLAYWLIRVEIEIFPKNTGEVLSH